MGRPKRRVGEKGMNPETPGALEARRVSVSLGVGHRAARAGEWPRLKKIRRAPWPGGEIELEPIADCFPRAVNGCSTPFLPG